MFCGKCGAEVLDGAKFCEKCGSSVEVESMNIEQPTTSNSEQVDIKSAFIDPNEKLVAKVGNGYFVNLLYSKVKKCNLLLTDKRIYLKGVFYTDNGRGITKMNAERILDIEDVTGTGFIYTRLLWIPFILDVICIILSLAMTNIFWSYGWAFEICLGLSTFLVELLVMKKILMSKKVMFYIEYAGGRISINANLIGIEDVRDLHKQMRRVKDNIKGKIS